LARRLSAAGCARLAALNPVGAPVGALFGVDGPSTWARAAAAAEQGAPIAPQRVAGVELLSPAGPEEGVAGWQVRRALEAWEGTGYTVFDAARSAPCGGWRCAGWADVVVVVARADPGGVAAARALRLELDALGLRHVLAVREVPGGFRIADVAGRLGCDRVVRIGRERGLAAGLAHGVMPGDRAAGPLAAAAEALAELMEAPTGRAARAGRPERVGLPARPERREKTRRHGMRMRRAARLPAFNPAAFAEEW
jgi:hypothetical protein